MSRDDLLPIVEARDWKHLLTLMVHTESREDRHLIGRAIRTVLREGEPSTAPAPPDINRVWAEHRAELLRRDDWRLPR